MLEPRNRFIKAKNFFVAVVSKIRLLFQFVPTFDVARFGKRRRRRSNFEDSSSFSCWVVMKSFSSAAIFDYY